jgi:hypothetical protein
VSTVVQDCCSKEDTKLRSGKKWIFLANKGYRVIAVPVGKETSIMEIAGLARLYDKPRQNSAKLIADQVKY